jgi:hypothetical protein
MITWRPPIPGSISHILNESGRDCELSSGIGTIAYKRYQARDLAAYLRALADAVEGTAITVEDVRSWYERELTREEAEREARRIGGDPSA